MNYIRRLFSVRAGMDELFLEHHEQQALCPGGTDDGPENRQTPQMTLMVGTALKDSFFHHHMGRQATQSPSQTRCDVQLFADKRTSSHASPILFADSLLHAGNHFPKIAEKPAAGIKFSKINVNKPHSLAFHHPAQLAGLLYARILFPFANTLCFFEDDFAGGLQEIATLLYSWLKHVEASPYRLAQQARPRLIFVRNKNPQGTEKAEENDIKKDELIPEGGVETPDEEQDERKALRKVTTALISAAKRSGAQYEYFRMNRLLNDHFSKVCILTTAPTLSHSKKEDAGMEKDWEMTRAEIVKELNAVHDGRMNSDLGFSYNHFLALINLACDQFCSDINRHFNFISTSRLLNPVPDGTCAHITEFMKMIVNTVDPDTSLLMGVDALCAPGERARGSWAQVIASALVLDEYPPGMHFFSPDAVFDELYDQVVANACRHFLDEFVDENISERDAGEKDESDLGMRLVQLRLDVRNAFVELGYHVKENSTTALFSHKNILYQQRHRFMNMHTTSICLACLTHHPQHTLRCSHSLCDRCVIVNDEGAFADSSRHVVKQCPLCLQRINNDIIIKPATAGVRVGSFDGGGMRALVILKMIRKIIGELGLDGLKPHDCFGLIAATSSGALCALSMFVDGCSAVEREMTFRRLAAVAFADRVPFGSFHLPRFAKTAVRAVLCCLTNSRYRGSGLSKAVEMAFGKNKPFFGSSLGPKVAITATTTGNPSTVLLSNYIGTNRPSDSGYEMGTAASYDLPMTTDVAKAATAVPTFYPAYKGYYDGALRRHNNPINMAIKEQDEYFERGRKEVDFAVSFGTGLVADGKERTNAFSNLWISKLYESLMGLMDGQNTWRMYYNAIPEQHRLRHHRLNMEFDGAEPQLDDLSCLTEITQKAANPSPLLSQQIRDIAGDILATFFYIGLDFVVWKGSRYVFGARILCRLPPGRSLNAIVTKLKASASTFSMNAKRQPRLFTDRTKVLCIDHDTTRSQQPFSRAIEFFASSLQDIIDIKFELNERTDGGERSISNCPYKVGDLIKNSKLHQIFGRADHKTPSTKRKQGYSRVVNVAKRRKLKAIAE